MGAASDLVGLRALLIDLSGTLHIDNEAIPGAAKAVKKAKEAGIKIKYVTNTTKARNCEKIRERNIYFSYSLSRQYHISPNHCLMDFIFYLIACLQYYSLTIVYADK